MLHRLLVIIKQVNKLETAFVPERTLEMLVIINNYTSRVSVSIRNFCLSFFSEISLLISQVCLQVWNLKYFFFNHPPALWLATDSSPLHPHVGSSIKDFPELKAERGLLNALALVCCLRPTHFFGFTTHGLLLIYRRSDPRDTQG